jgi:hypothetical protein
VLADSRKNIFWKHDQRPCTGAEEMAKVSGAMSLKKKNGCGFLYTLN